MLPYRENKLTRIALIIFFLVLIGYAYFEARGLLYGPMIEIAMQTAVVQSPYILIQGQTERIELLQVDGNPIPVTQTGAFNEPYVLAPGVNRIVFDAKDKYGHGTEKIVEIVYRPSATSTAPGQVLGTAISSAASASTTSSTSTALRRR